MGDKRAQERALMADDVAFPVDLDPLCERTQMVAPVAAFGVAHPFSRLSGELHRAWGVSVGPAFSISAAARPKITGARFRTAFYRIH
jgi:hypothetical protein